MEGRKKVESATTAIEKLQEHPHLIDMDYYHPRKGNSTLLSCCVEDDLPCLIRKLSCNFLTILKTPAAVMKN